MDETNPALIKHFEKVTGPERDRLRNMQQFRAFLEKRYQLPIANQIAVILAPKFNTNFSMPVMVDVYYKTIQDFVNDEKEVHMKFLFKLFDVFNEDKITEAGLFKFMEDASLRRYDIPKIPTEVLGLNEQPNDIFVDIFANTYGKIADALKRKVKKREFQAKQEALMNKGREAINKSLKETFSSLQGGQSAERASGQNFYDPSGKKKVDRGAVGSSMMSGHSDVTNKQEARGDDSPNRPNAN